MSNRAVKVQSFDAKDPFAGLALVTKPVPKAEAGEGVKTVKKEQRVLPFIALDPRNVEGSWRQYVCVKEELVWAVPDSISDEAAAQFIATPWTLYGMFTYLEVPAGEGVCVTQWNLYHERASAERRKAFTDGVSKLMEAKIVVPLVGETYDLGDFQLAIKKTLEVARGGKVLLSS
ncbi:unnamed protein product [Sphagnum jensenii]|uniref:Uncharacterized protein n=1 Tax=Sphagnum jensenii TaxID=128206 RepID=A0ABP0VAL2_9BRYO